MTAKDKAKELVHNYYWLVERNTSIKDAKQCTLIAVNEILKLPFENQWERNYLEEVKNEINKL